MNDSGQTATVDSFVLAGLLPLEESTLYLRATTGVGVLTFKEINGTRRCRKWNILQQYANNLATSIRI
jgi:hypothetical protein